MIDGNIKFDELSFEEALTKLEEVVKLLESGGLPLDKAVKIFEQGNKLRICCEKKLSEAKLKIENILTQQSEVSCDKKDEDSF
ncbi:MAG: exodeoxyribonuclease VII small subunit [Holosporales bacterium]|jgi:exodeoxyribonuclease VII small subunit|nr:exodeoxyribonuclease VII small subunit [Holosporales bacterium]